MRVGKETGVVLGEQKNEKGGTFGHAKQLLRQLERLLQNKQRLAGTLQRLRDLLYLLHQPWTCSVWSLISERKIADSRWDIGIVYGFAMRNSLLRMQAI